MAGKDGSVELSVSLNFGDSAERFASALGSALDAKIDAALAKLGTDVPAGGRGGRAAPQRDVASPATGSTQQTGKGGKAKTDIAFDPADVSSELQKAIGTHQFKLNIDEAHLITQIQNALNHAFRITLAGVQTQPAAGAPTVAARPVISNQIAQLSPQSLDAPRELREALHQIKSKARGTKGESVLPGAIDDLYDAVAHEFDKIGRSLPRASEPIAKLDAVFDAVGDKAVAEITRRFNEITAGSKTRAADTMKLAQEQLGIGGGTGAGLVSQLASVVNTGARSPFMAEFRQWRESRQPQIMPVEAPMPAAQPAPAATRAAPAPTSMAPEQERAAIMSGLRPPTLAVQPVGEIGDLARAFREEPGGRPRSRRGLADVTRIAGAEVSPLGLRRTEPGFIGPPEPFDLADRFNGVRSDPEAEQVALEQLGNAAGVRRPINFGALRGGTGAAGIDLRGIARAMSQASSPLRRLFRGVESGAFFTAPQPVNDEEREALKRMMSRRGGQTLPGADEQVRAVGPMQFIEMVARELHGEEGSRFVAQPEVQAELRKAIRQGSRIQPLGMAGSRGSGSATRASGEAFEHVASGSPASILGGIRDFEAAMAEGTGLDPETRAANARQAAEESRARIAGGVGLTDMERFEKLRKADLPSLLANRIDRGALPDFREAFANILDEVEAGGTPEMLTPKRRAKVFGTAEEPRNATGPAFARARADDLTEALLADAPKDIKQELRGYLKQLSSDVVGSIAPGPMRHPLVGGGTERGTSFREQDVSIVDMPTGRGQTAMVHGTSRGRARTAAEEELAALDAEIQAFEQKNAVLKGVNKRRKEEQGLSEFPVPEFDSAKLARRKELQNLLSRARQTEFAAAGPPSLSEAAPIPTLTSEQEALANQLRSAAFGVSPEVSRERAEQDRLQLVANARGRGRTAATGDDLRRAAAKSSIVSGPLPEEPAPAFAEFRRLMGEGAGGGGTRPPRGRVPAGPGGSGRGFGEVTGPIHVIVDNVPLPVTLEGAAQPGQPTSQSLGQMAGRTANFDFVQGRANLIRQTRSTAQEVFGREVERLRGEGKSDTQIKRAAKVAGLGVAAEAFFDDDVAGGGFGGGGGTGGGRAALNARRRRLGLAPIAFKTEETLTAIDEADTGRAGILAEVQRARRFEPKRGFTASVTDIFTNIFPFIERQSAAINRFAREGSQLASLEERAPALAENRAALESHKAQIEALRTEAATRLETARKNHESTAQVKAELGAYDAELRKTEVQLGAARDAEEELGIARKFQIQKTEEARRGLPGVGGKAAAFGAAGLAAGGAIAVGTLIAQAAGTIMEAIGASIAPALDKALGSPQATAAITNEIARSGAGGTFGAATARVAAEAGLAPFAGQDLITGRAAGIAGNANLAAQLELRRVQANIGRAGIGLPPGVDESIRTSTGGIFGSPIGIPGIGDFRQSTQELLRNGLQSLPDFGAVPTVGPGAPGRGEEMPTMEETLFGGRPFGNIPGGLTVEDFEKQLADGSKALEGFNREAAEGGSAMRLRRADFATEQDEVAAFAKSLRDVGLDAFAERVEKSGLLLQGGPSTGFSGAQFLAAAQRGAAGFDVPSLLAASEPQRRAREGLRLQQLGLRLGDNRFDRTQGDFVGTLGAQFGMEFAANPLPTGNQIERLGRRGGMDLSSTAQGYRDIAAAADAALESTMDFVATELPEFGAEFRSTIQEISSIGRQISNIKIGVETKQAALAADQYSFSIMQAERSLRDAEYLTGQRTKADRESVGYLQKQEFLLNRQSQQLQFQMTQRQINFQTALAGFQAPGITGQERAARMEEARMEAEFAQKQLDIQKEIFGLQGDQFMAQAARQVNDLQKQIALMVRGRELTLDTAKANKDVDVLMQRLQLVKGRADAIFQAAVAKREAMQQEMAELVAATGKDLARVANDVVRAYAEVYRRIINTIQRSLISATEVDTPANTSIAEQERKTGEDLNNNGRIGYASGIVGDTSGATDITVGEAGTEKVAIIRNPRPMTGGGGGTVNIGPFLIQGGSMDQAQMEMLGREIAELVERRLGMKAKLLDLRPTIA